MFIILLLVTTKNPSLSVSLHITLFQVITERTKHIEKIKISPLK